ncbi:unnamed protein product [Echinostoma caproni]|uniref:PIH1 domain-containing protein n=1 Tax=Echinostoma caproni TaxID=27848 RepID=A0A183B6F2_9TREM|nr:unnamed protein product [Echinostoma caproni]
MALCCSGEYNQEMCVTGVARDIPLHVTKSDKGPGGINIDEQVQMRNAVSLTRLDIEKVPQISSPKKDKNLCFAQLVASTPDASFADITTDEPTIVVILNRNLLSPMKPSHAPAKEIKGPTKVPAIRPIAGIK